MKTIEEWLRKLSDKELKEHFISLWESIYLVECFSSRDLIELELTARELERRGYEITEGTPRIRKAK